MPEGHVKWFDRKKGFGFLTSADGIDVFVHYANIAGDGHRSLDEGSPVRFDIEATPKGPQARNVLVVEGENSGNGRQS